MITIDNLSKIYRQKNVLKNISLQVADAECVALLGPNGAGKTTLLKILMGLIKNFNGAVLINNRDIRLHREEILKEVGYIPQNNSLDIWSTVIGNLMFQASLYKVNLKENQEYLTWLYKLTGIDQFLNKMVMRCSGGMQRRLAVAMSLIHKPKFLIIDEPTEGLDTEIRKAIWNILKNLQSTYGMTIIFTTHYLEEAEQVANKVIFLFEGKKVAEGQPSNLKENLGPQILTIQVNGEGFPAMFLSQIKNIFPSNIFYQSQNILKISIGNGDDYNKTFSLSKEFGASVTLSKSSLDDVFFKITGCSVNK